MTETCPAAWRTAHARGIGDGHPTSDLARPRVVLVAASRSPEVKNAVPAVIIGTAVTSGVIGPILARHSVVGIGEAKAPS